MRMRTLAPLLALCGALGSSACDEGKAPKAAAKTKTKTKSAEAKPVEAKAKPAAPAPAKDTKAAPSEVLALDALGLKADAPPKSTARESLVSSGVNVHGPDFTATVREVTDDDPVTEADAEKKAAEYEPKNLQRETLDDGWALTFEGESGISPNFFVEVRREIGGKAYWCETVASASESEPDPKAAQAKALALCKSLRP